MDTHSGSLYEILDEDDKPYFYNLVKYIKIEFIYSLLRGRYSIFYYFSNEEGSREGIVLQTKDLKNFIEACRITNGEILDDIICFDIETNTTFDLEERINI